MVLKLFQTDYNYALQLLKHLKLKIKISENFIKGDTMMINERSSIMGRFLEDGIEIESCPFITSAIVTGYLDETDYKNALQLIRHLKLKTKISENFIKGD